MAVDIKLPGVIFLGRKHCLRFCPKCFLLFFWKKVLSNNVV